MTNSDNNPSVIATFFVTPKCHKAIEEWLKRDYGYEPLIDNRFEGVSEHTAIVQIISQVKNDKVEEVSSLAGTLRTIVSEARKVFTDEHFIGASLHWFIRENQIHYFGEINDENDLVNIAFKNEQGKAWFIQHPSRSTDRLAESVLVIPNDKWATEHAISLVANESQSAEAIFTSIDLIAHKANWLISNILERSTAKVLDDQIQRAFQSTVGLVVKMKEKKLKPADIRSAVKNRAELAALTGALQLTRSMLNPLRSQASCLSYRTLKPNSDLYIASQRPNEESLPPTLVQTISQIDAAVLVIEKYTNLVENLTATDDAVRASREFETTRQINRVQVGIAAASAAISIATLFERETAIALWKSLGFQVITEGLVFFTEFTATASGAAVVYMLAVTASKRFD